MKYIKVNLPFIINQLLMVILFSRKLTAARILKTNYLKNKLVEYPNQIIQALQTSIQSR